jgi:hypothetical protein
MCPEITVTENAANGLVTEPGNPHLIWDGAESRVVTEDFCHALAGESAWRLIMTRADLISIDPGATTCHPASLAELLTTFASDFPGDNSPRTAG